MTVTELNNILARELGVNPYGTGNYRWVFSEDLWWPAHYTGRNVEKRTPGGIIYYEREYERRKMCPKLDKQWVVVKWCKPEELPHWESNFPGAGYPSRGYDVNTNWKNPPGVLPTYDDTQALIFALRQQMGKTWNEATDEFRAAEEKQREDIKKEVGDEIRDTFTAFLNVEPGSRGGSVSFPSVKRDIILPPDAKIN